MLLQYQLQTGNQGFSARHYLLRRPRGPDRMINLLILFMESFYSPSELREIGLGIAHDTLTLHDEMRVLYKMTFEKLIALLALARIAHQLDGVD